MSTAAPAPRLDRATVYVDLSGFRAASSDDGTVTDALLACIRDGAARIAAKLVVVDVCTSPSPDAATASATLRLLQTWQAEEADVYTREVNNTVPFMRDWECFVTCHGTANGAVTYALHRRQMPVLSLLCPSNPASTTQPARPRSAVEVLLHTSVPPTATLPEQEAAIAHFFALPTAYGTYCVQAPQISAESAAGVTASELAATATEGGAVVVVNRDGYPVRLPPSVSTKQGLLPPPPARFAGVLEELSTSSTAPMAELRRRNPLLPGVLTAFHRHRNRGLLRCLLHRGYRVEVIESVAGEDRDRSSAAEQVRTFVALGVDGDRDGPEALNGKQATAAANLRDFESRWLDMPMPLPQP